MSGFYGLGWPDTVNKKTGKEQKSARGWSINYQLTLHILELAFWRAAFWFERKRNGVVGYHASLSGNANPKTALGQAEIYRDMTLMLRRINRAKAAAK